MLNIVAAHGFGADKTPALQEAVAEGLALPFAELRTHWVHASLPHVGPSTLLKPAAFAAASTDRFEEQARRHGSEILGSWSVIVFPEKAPLGMVLAFVREVERRTGNAPGVVTVHASHCEFASVVDLPLRVRCRVGKVLVAIRNIWLHHSAPFLRRGSRVTLIALDGPEEGHYGNCAAVIDEEGERLLLPWCLVVLMSEWADGAYPNGEFGTVPPRIYPPLIPFLQHSGSEGGFWYDWPAVRPVGVALTSGEWVTVHFAW